MQLNGTVEWVIIAYLVVTSHRPCSDDWPAGRTIWSSGIRIFTTGSTTLGFLVAARGFQGLGGALLMAISPAMLTSAFPPLGRALA